MSIINKEKFNLLHDRGKGKFCNLSFTDCIFDNCSLSLTKDVSTLSTIENVSISDCQVLNCNIGPSYLKNVIIDNINTGDILLIWSALFHNVVLRNKIGKIKINKSGFDLYDNPDIQNKLNGIRQDFYSKIDWALDISEAKFLDFSCQGIPSKLIRRDSRTQVVVKREKLSSLDKLDFNFKKEHPDISFILEMFLRSDEDDIVLVTPLGRASRYSKPIFSGLMKLREMGIAEVD